MKIAVKRRETLAEYLREIGKDQYKIFHDIEEEQIRVYDEFAKQFISGILTKAKVREWKMQGYLVIAQTGTGKSTWVTRTIGEMLLEHHRAGLLITPRVALSLQYKKEIAQLYCPNLLEELTEQGLHKRNEYGPFDVYSFQEFVSSAKVQAVTKKSYEFIILDEVHAFVGDAAFNPFTEKTFRFLLENVGKMAKRVYLTATPEVILDEISQVEEKITPEFTPQYGFLGCLRPSIRLTIFRFKRDYGYVQPIFFREEDSVFKIMESLPEGKKGLIFVRSMKQGLEWQAKLGKERAVYLDATNKRMEKEEDFHNLLRNQKIDRQFLIVTRFMDVGVNIHDLQLTSVVLFHVYPEDVVQMLGRKRVAKDEKVQLYIKLPDMDDFKRELGRLEKEENEIKNNGQMLQSGAVKLFSEIPHPFYVEENSGTYCLGCNVFYERLVFYHGKFLKDCLENMECQRDFEENFSEILLLYLPGCLEPQFLDRIAANSDQAVQMATDILESKVGIRLDKEQAMEVANQLLKIFGEKRRSDQTSQFPYKQIKKIQDQYGIPYKFSNQSANGESGTWIVERGIV